MALGDLSRINSGYIGRGMGSSGLHQRALQQAQIQDLYSLGKEVNQSQATLRALDTSRMQAFNKEKANNLSEITKSLYRNNQGSGAGVGADGMGGMKDLNARVVNRRSDTTGGIESLFELTGVQGNKIGFSGKKEFKNLNELHAYLQRLNGVGIGGAPTDRGQSRNVNFLNPDQLSKLELKSLEDFF